MTYIQNLKTFDHLLDHVSSLNIAERRTPIYKTGDLEQESRFDVIWNTSTGKEICPITKKYQILQHRDAVYAILEAVTAAGITGSGTLRNFGDVISSELYFDNLTMDDPSSDQTIQLGMRFTNSFNKSTGFHGDAFAFRQACKNGMLVNRILEKSIPISFMHTGNILSRVSDAVKSFITNLVTIEETMVSLISKSQDEVIVFYNTEKQIEFLEPYAGSAKQARLIISTGSLDLMPTKWAIYNAMTSYASHDESISYNRYDLLHNKAQDLLLTPVSNLNPNKPAE